MKRKVCIILSISLLLMSLSANAASLQSEYFESWNLDVAMSNVVNYSNYSITINGTSLPTAEYPIGSDYGINTSYSGGGECNAFAMYIYDQVFMTTPASRAAYKEPVGLDLSTEDEAREFLQSLWAGTLIRSTRPHSMILLATDEDGAIVYHANFENIESICRVNVSHITWSDFADLFGDAAGDGYEIAYIYAPHYVKNWTSRNSTYHGGNCEICGATHTARHFAETAGTGTCLVCGYYGAMIGIQNHDNTVKE